MLRTTSTLQFLQLHDPPTGGASLVWHGPRDHMSHLLAVASTLLRTEVQICRNVGSQITWLRHLSVNNFFILQVIGPFLRRCKSPLAWDVEIACPFHLQWPQPSSRAKSANLLRPGSRDHMALASSVNFFTTSFHTFQKRHLSYLRDEVAKSGGVRFVVGVRVRIRAARLSGWYATCTQLK